MESEPNQQPNDNSTRQANSIGSEELDAAILAAVQRANDAHSVEPPADDSDDYVDAGFDMDLIDPYDPSLNEDEYAETVPLINSSDDDHFAVTGAMPRIFYSYNGDENADLSPQAPIAAPVEEVTLPHPAADDAVLGSQNRALASDAVLGGMEGVKRRLFSTFEGEKIAALTQALNYGQAGLELVIKALTNESKLVSQSAYFLLRDSSEPIAQQALQEYNPYRFFQCTFSGNLWNHGEAPIAISPDSQTLACGNRSGNITLWNLQTGKRLRTLRGHSQKISSVAISPDGQTVVSGSWDGSIKIWNLHTGEELHAWEGNSKRILSLAISPDGRTLISGNQDGTITIIKLWKFLHLHRAKRLHTFNGHSSGVESLAISPDGQTFVSASQDRLIKIWNLHTGERRNTLKHLGRLNFVAISPDGQILVSAGEGRLIKIWNLHTGEERNTLKMHGNCGKGIAISPDGQTLINSGFWGDDSLNFWNLSTGKQLHTLKGHSSHVNAIAISPDGQTLVSASEDGIIKVWGLQ